MEQQRIYYLLEQELEGRLSDAEARELEGLKAEEGNEQLEKAIAALIEREAGHPVYIDAALEDAGFERIMRVDVPVAPSPLIRSLRRNLFRIAAAVLLLLAAGAYAWRQWKPETPVIVQAEGILPGSSKAVLTLTDGSVVELDSTGNGAIRQGIRQQNGQLQYSAAGTGEAPGFNMLTVPRGGQYRLVLPDGTRVWLNAASSLKYPTAFNGKERVVELQGQGYFEIAKNAEQPFMVKVNGMEVQVLGTHFDVMAYTGEPGIHTTLLEGSLKVVRGNRQQLLAPGQQAVWDRSSDAISVQLADIEKVTAWKEGYFYFRDDNIKTVIGQVARWYDLQVKYEGRLPAIHFEGSISRQVSLEEVLEMLADVSGFSFKVEDRTLHIGPQTP